MAGDRYTDAEAVEIRTTTELMRAQACQTPEAQLLTLAGDNADPAAKAIKINTTVAPLEGGWTRLKALSARSYGQTLT